VIDGATISGKGNIGFGAHGSGRIENATIVKTTLLITSPDVVVRRNRFENQGTAIRAAFNGAPAVFENDFINTTVALSNDTNNVIDARGNYWGDPSGPGPTGSGGYIEGKIIFSPFATSPISVGTAIARIDGPGGVFSLENAYPNPVVDMARIPFSLPAAEDVRIDLFDLLGRRVAVVEQRRFPAGRHEASLQTSSLGAGTYIVVLSAGAGRASRAVTVVR
jgi:hypothetical protein